MILDRRTLNRTLLARQHLLERAPLGVEAMLEHLVGIQSQVPTSGYAGLWSRIDGFRPGDLADAFVERRVVRLVLQRSTLHLVTAADALAIRPLLAPMLAKDPYARGVDLDAVLPVARAFVEDSPRTPAELTAHLVERFPQWTGEALQHAARAHLALVQVPPRGVWGVGGTVRLTTLESWVGAEQSTTSTLDELVTRYLRAFGPASVKDFAAWSRLTGVRPVFERLRPTLRTFRDEHGVELFDVPDGVIAANAANAPVRFLPEFDNLVLAHADRDRIISDAARTMLNRENGYWPFVLAGGEVVATWSRRDGRVDVNIFGAITDAQRTDIEAEADRLDDAFSLGART